MANSNLTNAKKIKNDEFYTQFPDIQKEVEAYFDYNPNTFQDKVVYCNCDDPLESHFFGFFVLYFKKLKLKRLITTSYKPSPVANRLFDVTPYTIISEIAKSRFKEDAHRFIIDDVGDIDNDGEYNLKDIAEKLRRNKHNELAPLHGDGNFAPGDFRSKECMDLLEQANIVVTNPPFSLFREYIDQLFGKKKNFLIIGNMNAITYKEVFPLIKSNQMWLGNGFQSGNAYFMTPNIRNFANGVYDQNTGLVKFRNVLWFTNLDHGRRHQILDIKTMAENLKHNKKVKKNENAYKKYDNYDAIEVPYTEAIPSDYGIMGVPISFLDKYNPDQFVILGATQRGCHDEVPDNKKYDDYWEVRQDGQRTGSSGGKTNENANLVGNDGKKNYFINKEGRIIQSAYQRIFIRHKKGA